MYLGCPEIELLLLFVRNLSQGMELRVPVLFLDMSVLEEDEAGLPCPPSTLFGEKPETMIDIPIIKREENDVRKPCIFGETEKVVKHHSTA